MTYVSPTWIDVPPGTTPPLGAVTLDAAHLQPLSDAVAALSRGGTGITPANDTSGSIDTAAIQAALDAANAAGGGVVLLGAGTFYVNATLTIHSYTSLVGVGRNATVIKLVNGANVDVVQSYQFSSLTGGNTTGGVQQCTVSDLSIDGNKAHNTGSHKGFAYYGALLRMENVFVRNCTGDGLWSEWSNSGLETDGCEGHLIGVSSHDNGGNGFSIAGPHDSLLEGCVAFQNAAIGFNVKTGSAVTTFVACHGWGTNQTYAFYAESTAIFDACQAEGASVAEVMLGANDCTWYGGKVFSANVGAKVGIQVGDVTHSGVTGIQIDTRISDCINGAIDFTYAGSNGTWRGTVFQSSGTVVLGTLPGSWLASPLIGGVSGQSVYQNPAAPAVDPNALKTGESTMRRLSASSLGVGPASSGQLWLTYLTAAKNETINNVRIWTGSQAAAATPTLCRIGIYSVDPSTSALTLIASTANDTTLFAATSTSYTKALSVPFATVQGTRYAIGVLVVSGGALPKFAGVFPVGGLGEAQTAPKMCGVVGSLSDLPSTEADASVTGFGGMFYAVITP